MDLTLNDCITFIGMQLVLLDERTSEGEIYHLSSGKFFKEYYNPDSRDRYLELRAEGTLTENLLLESTHPILIQQSLTLKEDLVNSLISLSQADGEMSKEEESFIKRVIKTCELKESYFDDRMEFLYTKKSGYTINEMVTYCALALASIDGNIDEAEKELLNNHPFFAQHSSSSGIEKFNKHLNSDGIESQGFLSTINEDFDLLKVVDEEFKKEFLTALLQIVISTGNDPDQNYLFRNIADTIGFNTEKLSNIIEEENKKVTAELEQKKSATTENSDCFVVTATLGDVSHPILKDYREFRDQKLVNYFSGRIFIRMYYRFGPLLASIIRNNTTLRKLSLNFVIKPIHSLIQKSKG